MLDVQNIYNESYKELKDLGIPINEASVVLASLTEVTGKCQETDSGYEIKIMKRLVEEDNEKLVKRAMIHELLHTCKDTNKHDEKWREYARKAEDHGHYGLFESLSHSDIYGENKPIKKLYVCPNCGLSYKSTHDDEGELKCVWCNTLMNSVEFVVPEESK